MTPAPPARDPRSARYGSPSDRRRVLAAGGLRARIAAADGRRSVGLAAVVEALRRTRSALRPAADTT